jgi:hypothetical protein
VQDRGAGPDPVPAASEGAESVTGLSSIEDAVDRDPTSDGTP